MLVQIVNFHAQTHRPLFVLPVALWVFWFTHLVRHDLWFATCTGVTVGVMIHNFPVVVRKMYGVSHTYDDLNLKSYIERKLIDEDARFMVQKQYEDAFIVVATWVLSLASFSLVYMELFKFDNLPYSWGQIWSILSGAVAGVNMVQSWILSLVLGLLVRKQRTLFSRMHELNSV
jgi:hypothetical protein